MTGPGSVTQWLDLLKAGDPAAAQLLWENYFRRLVALARRKLQGSRRRETDEEDVALSAFDSFCRGADQGRFPRLADRNELWQLLVVITTRKAARQVVREKRVKRGGGSTRGESAFLVPNGPQEKDAGIDDVAGREPTPEFAAEVAEECQRLLERLDREELRVIALRKMDGHTNDEIAALLGCAVATVERRLRLIRKLWQQEQTP